MSEIVGKTGDGYPIAKKVDGRVVPFSQVDKPAILEKIFNGEIDVSTAEAYRAAKLTQKEKSLLMRDERYLEMLDAKLLDYERGGLRCDKLQLSLLKMVYERLNLINKSVTINNRTLRVGRILIAKQESPTDEALRLQREGRAAFPPKTEEGELGGLRAQA